MTGDNHDRSDGRSRSQALQLTTRDGRTVKVKLPGLPPRLEKRTEQRAATEPPRDDPRTLPFNPRAVGG